MEPGMNGQRILLVLGGTWHDFDGFARTVIPVLAKAGRAIDTTYSLDSLRDLDDGKYDVAVLYTCLTADREDGTPAASLLTDDHAAPLAKWVAAGGSLLAVHAATVSSQSSPLFQRLVGGIFISHPPASRFTVHPVSNDHPITNGLEAFEVHDEFYIERCQPDLTVQMVAIDQGIAHPLVWSRAEGKGRVAHVAMGHDEQVWNLPQYQQLLVRVIGWLTG